MKLDRLFTKHKTVVIVVLFFVALAARLYKIDSKNAWMDESKQAGISETNPFDFDLAERASIQQQPPLDYFIQSIAISNFGVNEIGIRVHAAIFGALTAVFFFLLLIRFVDNYPVILAGTLAFTFHPLLIYYSQEGRPISTAVFFSLLYLFFLVQLFQTTDPGKSLVQSFAVLTFIQAGFLLSVGFQPIIFLLVSSICLTPYLAVKEKRSRVLIAHLSSMSAFLISLPIIYLTIRSGARLQFIKQDSIFDMIKNVLQNIGNISLDNVFHFYRTILENYGLFFIAVIIMGVIGFILNSKKRDHAFVVWYFTMFFLMYPLVYTIVFNTLVSWKIHSRYFLTFVPVCFIVMSTAIYFSLDMFMKPGSFFKSLRYVTAFLLAVLFTYSFARDATAVSNFYHMKKTEWKKMYDIFKYDSQPGDIAYMLNLVNIDRYSPNFRAKNLYYPVKQLRPVKLKLAGEIPHDLKNPHLWKQKRNIYIVTRYGSGKIKKSFFPGLENIDVYLFENITLTRIKKSPGTMEDLISVLRALKAKLRRDESNYFPCELLIKVDLNSGNIEKARKNIEVLEAIDKRGKLNKLIRAFKKQLRKLEKIP
jgi:4-amino-4-deoxy-L-arabinose transferase-like glycosyltransferase